MSVTNNHILFPECHAPAEGSGAPQKHDWFQGWDWGNYRISLEYLATLERKQMPKECQEHVKRTQETGTKASPGVGQMTHYRHSITSVKIPPKVQSPNPIRKTHTEGKSSE